MNPTMCENFQAGRRAMRAMTRLWACLTVLCGVLAVRGYDGWWGPLAVTGFVTLYALLLAVLYHRRVAGRET